MSGEFELIDWIRQTQQKSPLLELGIGDDLAALNWPAGELLLIGVDQVIDGVHFDSKVHSLNQIGRKAVNRNLSDCAAMGCLPAVAVVAVALPRDFSLDRAKELCEGLRHAGDAFHCPIIGGDTASWGGKLALSVTILGRSAGVKPVSRNGARPGDGIFVTGPLGGSILGRHMTFEPRVRLGREDRPRRDGDDRPQRRPVARPVPHLPRQRRRGDCRKQPRADPSRRGRTVATGWGCRTGSCSQRWRGLRIAFHKCR